MSGYMEFLPAEMPIYVGPEQEPKPDDAKDWRDYTSDAIEEAQCALRLYRDDPDVEQKLRYEKLNFAIDCLKSALEEL